MLSQFAAMTGTKATGFLAMDMSQTVGAGYVYILDIKQKVEGRPVCKVGLERSRIAERPESIKVAVPEGLELIDLAYFTDPDEVERALHTHFKTHRLGSAMPYFSASPEDLSKAFGALVQIQSEQGKARGVAPRSEPMGDAFGSDSIVVDIVSLDALEAFELHGQPEASDGQRPHEILILETPEENPPGGDWWRDGAFFAI